MSVLDSLEETSEKASDIGEKFFKTSHRYYKLKIFQQLTFSISLIAKFIAVGSFVFIGFIFAALAGAIALGQAIDNLPLGFLIVSVVFALIGLVIYIKRTHINRLILEKIGAKYFSEDD